MWIGLEFLNRVIRLHLHSCVQCVVQKSLPSSSKAKYWNSIQREKNLVAGDFAFHYVRCSILDYNLQNYDTQNDWSKGINVTFECPLFRLTLWMKWIIINRSSFVTLKESISVWKWSTRFIIWADRFLCFNVINEEGNKGEPR